MKCKVCGKEYPAGKCPRCGYAAPAMLVGDVEKAEQEARAEALAWREELLKQYALGVEWFRHEERKDTLAAMRRESRFGTCRQIHENADGVAWLDGPFAAASGAQMTCRVCVYLGGEKVGTIPVTVPALPQRELLRVGMEVLPEGLRARLVLKNDSAEVRSEPFEILDI